MRAAVRRVAAAIVAVLGLPVAVTGWLAPVATADVGLPPPPPTQCYRVVEVGDRQGFEGSLSESSASWTLFAFVVSSRGCARSGSVSYQTMHGSTNSFDYTSTSGTITFAAGETGDRLVFVAVSRDGSPGPDERFWVRLHGASSSVDIDDTMGMGTILNDDAVCVPPPDTPPGHDYHCSE